MTLFLVIVIAVLVFGLGMIVGGRVGSDTGTGIGTLLSLAAILLLIGAGFAFLLL